MTHTKTHIFSAPSQKGLTLIETMSVCAIVGILSLLSIGGYTHYQKKTALSKLTQVSEVIKNRQQQFYLDARAYASNISVTGLNLENYMKEQGYTCIHTDYASTCSDKDFTLYITAITADAGTEEVAKLTLPNTQGLSLASFSLDSYQLSLGSFYTANPSYSFVKVAANNNKASETGIINSNKDKDGKDDTPPSTPTEPATEPATPVTPPSTTSPSEPASPSTPSTPVTTPSEESPSESPETEEPSVSSSIAMKTGRSFVLVAIANPSGRFGDLKSWIALDEKSKGLSVFAPQGDNPFAVAKTGKGPSDWDSTKKLSDL